jgi:hypothetical protein
MVTCGPRLEKVGQPGPVKQCQAAVVNRFKFKISNGFK